MAARDPKFREVLNTFDIVAPDGQPVRWTLNWFHKTGLKDRCYGPEMMLRPVPRGGEAGRLDLPLRQLARGSGESSRRT
jgi:UDP-N-acetyl-D-mannosaminuronic acid transferase (WecB/TagA/CpsF family)